MLIVFGGKGVEDSGKITGRKGNLGERRQTNPVYKLSMSLCVRKKFNFFGLGGRPPSHFKKI